ncbi:MAG: hypothetical protein AAF401_15915, partial [Pseudomonadota bacterium]
MSCPTLMRCDQECAVTFGDWSRQRLAGDVALYLAHLKEGVPLRRLAALRERCPSSILRTVRKIERMRDDPLVDRAVTESETRLRRSPKDSPKESV